MKSALYLLLFAWLAFLIGGLFLFYLRPQIIERGCSEIAQGSSNILFKDQNRLDPKYTFDNVKTRCLEDALKK